MAEPRVAASPACNELKAYHVKVFRDISYWRSGASNDETEHPTKHKLNVHIPVDDTGKIVKRKLPCVVHIHGGGWKRGTHH
jgi:acetyl esterase/lipase